MVLRAGFLLTALKLQEAADAMAHSNVRSRLSDAINDAHRGTGKWAYYVDHTGDGSTGDVIYTVDGGMKSAPYELGGEGKSATTAVKTDKAKDVVPHVTYKPHSTKESAVPQQDGGALDGKESGDNQSSELRLVESAATVEAIVLREARADYEIKLIAPGKGSSAFYPKEVLKRDGPKVFKSGTHVYLNHPTAAEEAARPEGDVKNLAGVLSSDAVYHESHAKGPGLYARMKVFADHATTVEEKAPHVGMSIRAGGVAEANRKQDGLPILKELTHAESVDVVTKAGAGGMILTEAARGAAANTQQEVSDMDAAELKKLQESVAAQATLNQKLLERALKGDAQILAAKTLKTVALPEASKQRVVDAVLRESLPVTEAGELDTVKFAEAVNAAAKSEAEYVASLTGAGRVVGMGAGAAPAEKIDPKEAERREADQKRFQESSVDVFTALCGGNATAGKNAAFKGVN
jgi:hypothetical protein